MFIIICDKCGCRSKTVRSTHIMSDVDMEMHIRLFKAGGFKHNVGYNNALDLCQRCLYELIKRVPKKFPLKDDE